MFNNEENTHHYHSLTPDLVLDAIESVGLNPDASLLALNSYENRVYQFKTTDDKRWVIKVYRPERWSPEQIEEEHQFCFLLEEEEIPVIAPWKKNQESLFQHEGFMFSIYPSRGGRVIDLESAEQLKWMGRTIARIHNIGCEEPFQHRVKLSVESFGVKNIQFLKQSKQVPLTLETQYFAIAEQVVEECQNAFKSFQDLFLIRVHGDCHPGNILWHNEQPLIMDFDDCMMAPAIQDLWMMIPNDGQSDQHWNALLEGYASFRQPPVHQLSLIEPLRTLRIINYTAWIAKRWSDPTFQHNFSWFAHDAYWESQILILKEQLSLLREPPLIHLHF